MRLAAAASCAALLASCAIDSGHPGAGQRSYVNPVLDRDFPDPAVLRSRDGWFYAYATQAVSQGTMINIQVARSHDLVAWEYLGDALPRKPAWSASKQKFWAPHVIYDEGQQQYFMYYSAEPDDATGKCLAVAVSAAPAGPFSDSGAPLVCGQGIEQIDPMAFDDPRTGRHLLYWGSGSEPIKVRELAPDRLGFLPGSAPQAIVFPEDTKYRTLIEGAWVVYRDGNYYLFYSGDRCCAREPRYALMAARAADAFGPFESLERPVLEANGFWLAPGHNSVVTDDAGRDWLLYHATDAARAFYSGDRSRVMLLDRLVYEEGWPRVEDGQPSASARAAPFLSR